MRWSICWSGITPAGQRDLMDRFMPQWRHYRDVLNQAPLSHETWNY
ncbi:hypothetical protein [Methanoculleus sp. UBA416]|uniref:Uncharacterized protein n=1 Tax=Methanoculleus palmolei TaxID=72612 RepID=A0ABD8A9S3_9EURY|nr:hypothetical protein R6Y95_02875 [Methanoculleus palmolei]